jgi:hypothetical protein
MGNVHDHPRPVPNAALFARWRNGEEVPFGNARDWLAASQEGKRLDALAAPAAILSTPPEIRPGGF